MKEVKDFLWVLKSSWEEEKEANPVEEDGEVKPTEEEEKKEGEIEVVASQCGGAICMDSEGFLLTTLTAIISKLTPNEKSAYHNILKNVKVMARCYNGFFRETVFVGEKEGLVFYKIVKKDDSETFKFINLPDINVTESELTPLGKVFAFVQSGGNFSFRRGITNTNHPRVLEAVVNKEEFPYKKSMYMNSGMSGCAVFKTGETSHFVGLIIFCLDQFSLVIPVSSIRNILRDWQEEGGGVGRGIGLGDHEEDNPTDRTLDFTSSPEVGPPTNQGASDATFFGSKHSVLTIVFHLPFESNLPESVAIC